MKHRHIALAVLLTSTLVASPVFAMTASTTKANFQKELEQKKTEMNNLREAKQKELQDKKGELEAKKNELGQKREEMKTVRADFNARIVNNKIRSDIKVFTATANRLDKIISRIESRIVKIKVAGGTTTNIEASLAVGQTKLADARTDIAAFSSIDLTSATSGTTARTLLDTIKADAIKAKADLQASHAALVKATTLMQGVEKKVKVKDDNEGEASTTKSSN